MNSLNEDQVEMNQTAVLNVIKANPGCVYATIYAKVDVDKNIISLILHRLTQQTAIYKEGAGYHAVITTGNKNKDEEVRLSRLAKVTLPSAPLAKVEPVQQQVVSKPTPVIAPLAPTYRGNPPVSLAPAVPKQTQPERIFGKLRRKGERVSLLCSFIRTEWKTPNLELRK